MTSSGSLCATTSRDWTRRSSTGARPKLEHLDAANATLAAVGLDLPADAYLFSSDPMHATPRNPDWASHKVSDLAAAAGVADWLLRPAVRRGLAAVGAAGLVYDLLIRPRQLPAALHVTQRLDGVMFVLDHGAKPDIAAGSLQPWAKLTAELARRPNVVCKLSGLVTEAGARWTTAQICRVRAVR